MEEKLYYAFSVELNNGQSTFSLLPLKKDTPFLKGQYFPQSETLVLLSPNTTEVFDLVEKFDSDGRMEFIKGTQTPKKERLRLNNNVDYQLRAADVKWFIETYVVNPGTALEIIHKSKIKLHTAENMETVEEVKKNLIITE